MEHRSAHSVIYQDAQVFQQGRTKSIPAWGEWSARHSVNGMGPVELDDKIHIIFPDGAVCNKQHPGWYDPHPDPVVNAEWRLKHAEAWLKAKVEEFERVKWQAQENPLGADWVPELTRLRSAVAHAKLNLDSCRESLEVACGRGREWERQRKQQEAAYERGRQAQLAREGAVRNAIYDIKLDDAIPLSTDDE